MKQFLSLAAGTALALAGALAAAPAAAQQSGATQSPEANEYRTFVAAQEIDNRCMKLAYVHRQMLDDTLLSAMLDLPGITETSSVEMGYQAYYDNIARVADPISAEGKEMAAKVTCEQADQMLGELRIALTADIFAHVQLSGEEFGKLASDRQKRMASSILSTFRQSLAQLPEGTLESFVHARMVRSSLAGKEAAQQAIALLNRFRVSSAVGAIGHTLRWDNGQDGWVLVNQNTDVKVPSFVFADPEIIRLHQMEDTGSDRSYSAGGEVLVLPHKGASLSFTLLPAEFNLDLSSAVGRIEAGTGEMSAAFLVPTTDLTQGEAKASTAGCLQGAYCLRFARTVGDSIKRRLASGMNPFGMQFILVKDTGNERKDGPTEIRRRTKPVAQRLYTPHLGDIFGDQSAGS